MNKARAIILPTLTFLVGLTAGALVAGQVLSTGPDPQQLPPGMEAPADASDRAAAQPSAALRVQTETAPAAVQDTEASSPAPAELPTGLQTQLQALADGWGRMQAEVVSLRERVAMLERRAADAAETRDAESGRSSARPRTPEEQRAALVGAGVDPGTAEEVIWRRAQVELDRLDLRDQAVREGWLNTDRYREELRALSARRVSMRDEIGADAYDRYLYAMGKNNRISVDSVIPGSAGDQSGLLPGDVIESYGQQPVLDFNDLRQATSDGERGELVPVQVRRGDAVVELWLPRGPIGIRLDSTRVDPNG